MGATSTRRTRRSSINSSTERRGAVTKSVVKRNRKTGTKARNISESDSPPNAVHEGTAPSSVVPEKPAQSLSSIEPSQANEVGSEKKEDNTKTVYEYKVIQVLDFPGHTFEAGKERKVLATFDNLEKARQAAWEHYEFLTLYAQHTSSGFLSRGGLGQFVLIQYRAGKERSVRIEIHKEACEPQKDEQKPRAPREVFVVMMEWREISIHSDDEGKLKRMSISGVYQDQESAVEHLQELSKEYRRDWMSKRKKVGDYREKDFFERFDAMKDGRPSMSLMNKTEGTLIKIGISVDFLR